MPRDCLPEIVMRFIAAAAAISLLLPSAWAASKADVDKAVAAFVASPSFTMLPEGLVDDPMSKYQARFAGQPVEALRPDAAVGPVEKALLIVETMEATQPERVRYVVSYGQVSETEGDDLVDTISLVEVRRYNLGPLLHRTALAEYGPENTGDPSQFGLGPDVAWRFAFSPVMGNLALPLSMSRRVIAEGADQLKVDVAETCPAGPCRQIAGVDAFDLAAAGIQTARPYEPIPVPDIGTPPYTRVVGSSDAPHVSAAVMGRWLSAMLNLTETTDRPGTWATPAAPTSPEIAAGGPFIFFQLDQNLGQDLATSGLASLIGAPGSEAAQTWVRTTAFGDIPPAAAQVQIIER